MTCDAVDGKHARNTKQSTPLGAVALWTELFHRSWRCFQQETIDFPHELWWKSSQMAPSPSVFVVGSQVDHGLDAFCAFTTGIAVTVTADPDLKDPMLMLAA